MTGAWASEFDRVWPLLAPALERTGGTHAWSDVFREIETGSMQLWPGERAAAITEIVAYPRLKACRVFLAGGALDELRAMEPAITAWARGLGCTRIEVLGRPGWGRALTGSRSTAAWMMKEI